MITFEEFFRKKKINLVQFQASEPGLFAEFSSHYPLMGEKSFDHTKKYWFNGLRRTYPLREIIKPHAVQAEAISQLAVQGVAVAAAQNVDAGIERPKFAEDNLPGLVDENVSVKEVSLAEEEKIIVGADSVKSGEGKSEEREPAKPAFKPRFNMQNIKKEVVKEVLETENQFSEPAAEIKAELPNKNPQPITDPAKPVFKPRFNMQHIKKEVVKEVSENETQTPESEAEIKPEPATENPQPATDKPTYKPRFQMKNMPKPPTDQA